MPEFAFIGRSNVGKSSLLGVVLKRNHMVRVSRTPGRTQLLNMFVFEDRLALVDLPGYGYAKVPEKIRDHWETLLSSYLQTREALCGLILLMDIRRPFTELDTRMLDWFLPTGKPVHLVLTKADKLTREQAKQGLSSVKAIIANQYSSCDVQLFSSVKMIGIDETRSVITRWLDL